MNRLQVRASDGAAVGAMVGAGKDSEAISPDPCYGSVLPPAVSEAGQKAERHPCRSSKEHAVARVPLISSEAVKFEEVLR